MKHTVYNRKRNVMTSKQNFQECFLSQRYIKTTGYTTIMKLYIHLYMYIGHVCMIVIYYRRFVHVGCVHSMYMYMYM